MAGGKTTRVRAFKLSDSDELSDMRRELHQYKDVLLGRDEPPVDTGITTLMEVAEAYHARAMEMSMHIHEQEAHGAVVKGSQSYKFRVGELRDFIDLVRRSMEMGSRRVTALDLEVRMRG